MFGLIALGIIAVIVILSIANWIRIVKYEEQAIHQQRQAEIKQIHQQAENLQRDSEQAKIDYYRKKETDLAAQYAASSLLTEILDYLCENKALPEEFTIRNHSIQSISDGIPRTYDFTVNRVPHLESARGHGTNDVEQYLVRPQFAMARAINYKLNNEYDISDHANRTHEWIDSGTFYNTYESNFVQLRLKARKHF